MNIHSLTVDEKGRITLPAEAYDQYFAGKTIIYGIAARHHYIISAEELSGVGIATFEIQGRGKDGGHRIHIPIHTIEKGLSVKASGFTPDKKLSALWVPERTQSGVRFLLFIGEEGQKTWEQIRDT